MDPEERWQLCDFGFTQFFFDCVTGLCQRVFGSGSALFDDGPFSLGFVEDKPVLFGLEGDENTPASRMDGNWTFTSCLPFKLDSRFLRC